MSKAGMSSLRVSFSTRGDQEKRCDRGEVSRLVVKDIEK